MFIKCLFSSHDWDGCKCRRCGKTRDEQHDWDRCKCKRCGEINPDMHEWVGCICTFCNAENHDWIYKEQLPSAEGAIVIEIEISATIN